MSDVPPTSAQPAVSNWNLPNVLTGLRIVLVPFFGFALLHDGGDSILWRCIATALFFVAMVTDKIDGDIARSRNLVTNFGKIADPIADKAMTGMAFIGLSIVGDVWWWVTAVVLLREWAVTLLRLSILRRVVVAAAQSGKVKTVLQAIARHGGGAVLPGRGGARRRRRDDDVVGLRVLPRRVAPAHRAAGPSVAHRRLIRKPSPGVHDTATGRCRRCRTLGLG
jgi:CDP-diacylglycerol--glycerol-3-phosphate 3-phosphatidyltransferase